MNIEIKSITINYNHDDLICTNDFMYKLLILVIPSDLGDYKIILV